MSRTQGRTDPVEQKVVGFPQWPPKVRKSLAKLDVLQFGCTENVL